MTNFKRRQSPHKFCKCLLSPSWFLSWLLACSSRNSQAISDSAWKGMCILFTAVLKPYSIKRLPKPLTSILLNIPPTLRNYYLIQGVISSWSYYTHPPWQSREKKLPNCEALESQSSKHPHVLRSTQIYFDLNATRPSALSWCRNAYLLANSKPVFLQWASTRTQAMSQPKMPQRKANES